MNNKCEQTGKKLLSEKLHHIKIHWPS